MLNSEIYTIFILYLYFSLPPMPLYIHTIKKFCKKNFEIRFLPLPKNFIYTIKNFAAQFFKGLEISAPGDTV